MLERTEGVREDWNERGGTPKRPLTPSIFPDDAAAIIYRPARSAMTSGKANTRHWKLRFDRRTPPFIEPLMGWTGGDDPLAQVELTFPTRDAAVAYAERQGLTFTVQSQDREGHTGSAAVLPETERVCHRPRAIQDRCAAQAVKNSLTVVRHDSEILIEKNRYRKDQPCQTWKRQFANVPTTSGSPMVNPRARRTSIG
jgi:hypothetical protein